MPGPITAVVSTVSSVAGLNPISTMVTAGANGIMPLQMPDMNETIHAYLTGWLSTEFARTHSTYHGFTTTDGIEKVRYTKQGDWLAVRDIEMMNRPATVVDTLFLNQTYYPSIQEALHLENRKVISPQLSQYIIESQVGLNPALANAWRETRFEIPGPSDLIRFAVKEAFTPEIVERYGYAKEFPKAIVPWMEKQGYGQTIGIPRPRNATDESGSPMIGEATFIDSYWWGHWETVSPTQAYLMLHRLYADSPYGPSPFYTGTNEFNSQDLAQLLKVNDYPEFWRERLESISYHQLNRSDVIPMYRDGLIDYPTLYHGLRASGYRHEEAEILGRFAQWQKDKALGGQPHKRTLKWIERYYKQGIISSGDAHRRIQTLGLTLQAADSLTQLWHTEIEYETKEQGIDTLKRGYIRGNLSDTDLENGLNELRLDPFHIPRYMRQWRILKLIKYRPATTRSIIKGYELGILTIREFTARLNNLGYDDRSVTLIIRTTDDKMQKAQTLAMQKAAREQAKQAQIMAKQQIARAKEQIKAQKETAKNLEGAQNRRVHKIVVASTDKNIIEWHKLGLIKLWEVYYRLYHRDYTIADAARWVLAKIPDLQPGEYNVAASQAQKIYGREPNPPLSNGV